MSTWGRVGVRVSAETAKLPLAVGEVSTWGTISAGVTIQVRVYVQVGVRVSRCSPQAVTHSPTPGPQAITRRCASAMWDFTSLVVVE